MLRKTGRARAKLKELPFNKMAPNIVTLFALSAGLTSIRFSAAGEWERAVVAIIIAAILDGLDGRVARLLQGVSKFGAELDSLSDFLCFGVAPAILMFFWSMHDVRGFGWVLCVLYAMCCALRLARFNTMLEDEPKQNYWAHFFVGVPAPAGAGLVMLPAVFSFDTGFDVLRSPYLVGFVLLAAAALMISQIPTVSLKRIRIPAIFVLPLLLFVGLVAGFVVSNPWLVMGGLTLLYIVSIPFSVAAFLRKKRVFEANLDERENKEISQTEPQDETAKDKNGKPATDKADKSKSDKKTKSDS